MSSPFQVDLKMHGLLRQKTEAAHFRGDIQARSLNIPLLCTRLGKAKNGLLWKTFLSERALNFW